MGEETYTDGNRLSLLEATPNQLDGKYHFLVELGAADETCQLLTVVGNEIGTVRDYLQPGQGAKMIDVRLLGKNGTTKVVQSGAIAKGARVMADSANLGQVKAVPGTTGTYRSIGRKLTFGNGAGGDVIAINDVIETIIVP